MHKGVFIQEGSIHRTINCTHNPVVRWKSQHWHRHSYLLQCDCLQCSFYLICSDITTKINNRNWYNQCQDYTIPSMVQFHILACINMIKCLGITTMINYFNTFHYLCRDYTDNQNSVCTFHNVWLEMYILFYFLLCITNCYTPDI